MRKRPDLAWATFPPNLPVVPESTRKELIIEVASIKLRLVRERTDLARASFPAARASNDACEKLVVEFTGK